MADALPQHSEPDHLSDELLSLLEEIWQDLGGGSHPETPSHQPTSGDAEVAGQVVGPSPAELESLQEFLQFECGLSPSFTFIAGEEEEDCSSSSSPSGSSSPEVNVLLVMPPTSVYNADCSSPSTSSPSSSPHHSITSSTSSSDSGVASTADLTEFLEETLFDMDVDAFLRSLEDSNGLAFLSDRL